MTCPACRAAFDPDTVDDQACPMCGGSYDARAGWQVTAELLHVPSGHGVDSFSVLGAEFGAMRDAARGADHPELRAQLIVEEARRLIEARGGA